MKTSIRPSLDTSFFLAVMLLIRSPRGYERSMFPGCALFNFFVLCLYCSLCGFIIEEERTKSLIFIGWWTMEGRKHVKLVMILSDPHLQMV